MLLVYIDRKYMYVINVKCKILCRMSKYDIMNVIFVSSRPRGIQQRKQGYQIYRTKETVNILIPCDLIERLLTQRAKLQIQIGAVPDPSLPLPRSSLRPDSARLISRHSNWSSIEEIPTCPEEEGI